MNTGTITLNVNAQDLINTAELFSESGSRVASITEQMMNLVTGLSCVWNGDAAESYISKFSALDDDIMRMLSMINEHVVDLETIAENYINAEASGIDYTESLSVDVII